MEIFLSAGELACVCLVQLSWSGSEDICTHFSARVNCLFTFRPRWSGRSALGAARLNSRQSAQHLRDCPAHLGNSHSAAVASEAIYEENFEGTRDSDSRVTDGAERKISEQSASTFGLRRCLCLLQQLANVMPISFPVDFGMSHVSRIVVHSRSDVLPANDIRRRLDMLVDALMRDELVS